MTSSVQQQTFHVCSSVVVERDGLILPSRPGSGEAVSTIFSYYNKQVEIHGSARRHGVADQDILHAIDHALAIEDAGEDPDRWLIIGPDNAANLLEVVVMITAEDHQLVIHAMPMRKKYARLLEP